MAEVAGLKDGRSYYVWVAAVDRDGNRLQEAAPRKMTVKDNLAPRPVAVEAFPVLSRNGALLVRWRPHRLDFDLAGFNVVVGSRQQSVPASRRELLVDGVGTRPLTVSVAAKDTRQPRPPRPPSAWRWRPPRLAEPPASAAWCGRRQAVAGATVTAVTPDGQRRQTTSRADGRYFLRLPTGQRLRRLTPSSLTRVRARPRLPRHLDTLLLLRTGDRLTADLAPRVRGRVGLEHPVTDKRLPDAERPRPLGIDWLAVRGETEGRRWCWQCPGVHHHRGRADPLAPVGAASGGAKQPSPRPPAADAGAAVVGTFFADKNSTATRRTAAAPGARGVSDPFLEASSGGAGKHGTPGLPDGGRARNAPRRYRGRRAFR